MLRRTRSLTAIVRRFAPAALGVGVLAWKGLSSPPTESAMLRRRSLEGAEAIAVTELDPKGIVRVHGENCSAESLNGTIKAKARVQVINAKGVRLEVWGEETEEGSSNPSIDGTEPKRSEP